jgi:glycosyltransferase involved in cell wall biosynthesis
MRIALVADEEPGWGGIGTYTGVLGDALAALGHDVQLVLRGWEQEGAQTQNGVTVHRVVVPEPSWRRGTVVLASRFYVTRESLVFAFGVARALARIAPDVVEAPEFHAPALIAALRARLGLRAPAVVVRLHAPAFLTAKLAAEPPDLDVRAGEALEAAAARFARVVTSPSFALAALVGRRWRLSCDRIRVVPNPIDEATFAPAGDEAECAGRILIVGRVERAKGHDVLIEALPRIREAVPEAHLLLVGSDGGATEPLERRAAELGVREAVRFAGARGRGELPPIYRSAAVCAVPSRFEAFPYVALEAMACGRPVIASKVGGLLEVIDDGNDGLLVAPESPAALAAAITRLLLDAAERRRLGRAARERVETAYTASTVAARMAEHYAEAIH